MKFSIGEMAKLHNINIQTLRYYHTIGLLVPIEVDSQSGYRYYDDTSSQRLWKIKALQSTGLSLSEIKKLLNGNISETEKLFNNLKSVIDENIENLKKVSYYVEEQLKHINDLKEGNYFIEPRIMVLERREGYLIDVSEGNTIDNVVKALVSFDRSYNISVEVTFKPSRLVTINEKGEVHLKSYLALSKGDKLENSNNKYILEKGLYAVIDHIGSPDSLEESYDRLLNYVKEQDMSVQGIGIEELIIGSNISSNTKEWVRQIQILLK
ncbi:MerR family transcriptional regulator [Clostridium sp.]|uniref:MerR family transcriptional regulator n=1 Tax=Clostridium sp. TaxID=1506 RepID=UPI003217FAA9